MPSPVQRVKGTVEKLGWESGSVKYVDLTILFSLQHTELTSKQRNILNKLKINPPKRILKVETTD